MSNLRVLCLLLSTGIGGYLYKSFPDNQNKNSSTKSDIIPYLQALCTTTSKEIGGHFYKTVMKQLRMNVISGDRCDSQSISAIDLIDRFHSGFDDLIENEEEEFEENEDHFILTTGVPSDKSTFATPLVYDDPDIATRQIITYPQFTIFVDREGRTNSWAVERIDSGNVEHFRHRHFEGMVLGFKDPNQSYSTVNLPGDLANIRSTKLEPDPGTPEHFICKNCESSSFWPVFHKYVKFLTGFYEKVYVCSGCLFLKEPCENSICAQETVSNKCPTHFFKIIVCKNPDWTFRFECYKIKIEPMNAERVDLKEYLVSREQMDHDAGIHLVEYVELDWVSQTQTHPEFQSFNVPPRASNLQHICQQCVPFTHPL